MNSSAPYSPENIAEAKDFATAKTNEIQQSLNEGSFPIRLMALLGGLAMMIVSALGILGNILTFRWISAILQIYTFILGTIIIVLESSRQLSFFDKIEFYLYKYALFIKYVWGRGLLYFFAGTLLISFRDFFNLLVGFYVCAVGIIFIIVGRSTARKLSELRRQSIPTETLQEQFAIADTDGDGSLNQKQFKTLAENLGMDLTEREAESAFIQIGGGKGVGVEQKVRYETFVQWWNKEATQQIDDFRHPYDYEHHKMKNDDSMHGMFKVMPE